MAARSLRRMDDVNIADEIGLVLRGFSGKETVEIFEPVAGGPVIERSGGSRLFGRRVVPLSECGGAVAVVFENLGDHRAGLGLNAGVSVPVVREFGDLAGADAVMISSSEQRGAGGRAHRGGVEAIVGNAFAGDAA